MAIDRGMRHAGVETLAVLGAYCRIIQVGCYDLAMPDIKHAGVDEKFRRILLSRKPRVLNQRQQLKTGAIFCRWRCNSAKRSVSSA
jgi:hypothetical protein